MGSAPSVSVVVVNWNGGDDLIYCVESVYEQSMRPHEVILVDNASVDGSLEKAKDRFAGLLTIRHDANLGFGPGVNHGVRAASGEWVALLNNDAIADRDWLAAMLDA